MHFASTLLCSSFPQIEPLVSDPIGSGGTCLLLLKSLDSLLFEKALVSGYLSEISSVRSVLRLTGS